jgi:hypothetical protein
VVGSLTPPGFPSPPSQTKTVGVATVSPSLDGRAVGYSKGQNLMSRQNTLSVAPMTGIPEDSADLGSHQTPD